MSLQSDFSVVSTGISVLYNWYLCCVNVLVWSSYVQVQHASRHRNLTWPEVLSSHKLVFLLTPPKAEIYVKIPCHVHRLMNEVFLVPFPGTGKLCKSLGFIKGIQLMIPNLCILKTVPYASITIKTSLQWPHAGLNILLGHYDFGSHFPLFLGLSYFFFFT